MFQKMTNASYHTSTYSNKLYTTVIKVLFMRLIKTIVYYIQLLYIWNTWLFKNIRGCTDASNNQVITIIL